MELLPIPLAGGVLGMGWSHLGASLCVVLFLPGVDQGKGPQVGHAIAWLYPQVHLVGFPKWERQVCRYILLPKCVWPNAQNHPKLRKDQSITEHSDKLH